MMDAILPLALGGSIDAKLMADTLFALLDCLQAIGYEGIATE